MLINILWHTLDANQYGGPSWRTGSIFSCCKKLWDCLVHKPITTQHQSVFWLVSQSRRTPAKAIYVGICRWISLAADSADPVVATTVCRIYRWNHGCIHIHPWFQLTASNYSKICHSWSRHRYKHYCTCLITKVLNVRILVAGAVARHAVTAGAIVTKITHLTVITLVAGVTLTLHSMVAFN